MESTKSVGMTSKKKAVVATFLYAAIAVVVALTALMVYSIINDYNKRARIAAVQKKLDFVWAPSGDQPTVYMAAMSNTTSISGNVFAISEKGIIRYTEQHRDGSYTLGRLILGVSRSLRSKMSGINHASNINSAL